MFSVCFVVLEQSCGMRAKRQPRAKDMTWPFPHIMRGSLSTKTDSAESFAMYVFLIGKQRPWLQCSDSSRLDLLISVSLESTRGNREEPDTTGFQLFL